MISPKPIEGWLTMLAELTRSPENARPTPAKVMLYADALAHEFPIEVFSRQSLYDLGKEFTYWPSYHELYLTLERWMNTHRETAPKLTIPSDNARPWERRSGETNAHHYARHGYTETKEGPYTVMVPNRPEDMPGYPPADMTREWDDAEGILRLVRKIQTEAAEHFKRPLLMQLGAIVRQWAPQHFQWLPPEIVALAQPETSQAEQPGGPDYPKALHLTIKQIHAYMTRVAQEQDGEVNV